MDPAAISRRAAAALRGARVLIVTAGAGMGVDSGLPDFRGPAGFWRAYPMYERLGLAFEDAADPVHFGDDPAFGWGFYGHRLRLYRETVPHAGFGLLRAWADRYRLATFVVTSNVDGQFQKAGFDPARICEIHGSIHHLQCQRPCSDRIWENHEEIPVDETTMRAQVVPRCPGCGAVARPNILMFSDWSWVPDRSAAQQERLNRPPHDPPPERAPRRAPRVDGGADQPAGAGDPPAPPLPGAGRPGRPRRHRGGAPGRGGELSRRRGATAASSAPSSRRCGSRRRG
jgi:NAD-dependent SIR2 family protein deacetylase